MGGQVLGGGVIVLVAVALWMIYLLPTWHSRYRYDAAERNAVRLNQALRVLAETTESPDEVRLELSARTVLAQQKLARRVQHEREELRLQTDRERLAEARREVRTARATSDAHHALVRRRVRLVTTVVALVAGAAAAWGAVLAASGLSVVLWSALGLFAVCTVVLAQMARVARRAAVRPAQADAVVVRTAPALQDLAEPEIRATWTPRELPRPLTSSVGSRASAVLDQVDAQEALRHAALAEAMRAEAERRRPPSIATARVARAVATPDFSRMGVVDDAEIEDHVRRLLASRAAG